MTKRGVAHSTTLREHELKWGFMRRNPFLGLLLVCLVEGGMAGTSIAADPTPGQAQIQPYLGPQQMVAVDGNRRLNLYCVGKGEPTVLFDSGMAELDGGLEACPIRSGKGYAGLCL